MTLITAMLILIYKKANNLGYKTAKRRFVFGAKRAYNCNNDSICRGRSFQSI
jgi:hypothetical protein